MINNKNFKQLYIENNIEFLLFNKGVGYNYCINKG